MALTSLTLLLVHATSTMANSSQFTNTSLLAHATSTMANGTHFTNVSPLAHAISTMANGSRFANTTPLIHDATSTMTNDSLPLVYADMHTTTNNSYSPLDYAIIPYYYITEHTTTIDNCDTCHVLSMFNEPCDDYDPTIGLDSDPNMHTDSLIPQIDTILDDEIKKKSELEEGEIIDKLQAYVPLAHNENIEPFDNYPSHLLTASAPSYPSPLVLSHGNEALDVFYTNPTFDESVKTRLNPILEDKCIPQLIPSIPFKAEPYPALSLTPPPTTGSIPYHRLIQVNGQTTITFDSVTHLEAEQHILTEHARYNDYHSAYIPNVVHAIESFTCCQDGLIMCNWNEHMFKDGKYGGHPMIVRDIKLPTGGPWSGQTWHKHICELCDHHMHSQHLLNIIKAVLSTRMLAEASSQAKILNVMKCYMFKAALLCTLTKEESERKRLNSYAAITEHHGELQLASKILNVLLMPIPV
ncbi:hypothetical protein EDD22DRAFT_954411 [Suillus occidentalis]|nr:hypothetical protein EDD22DRAFT_954411 [Suillus occidentalis]